MGSFAYNIASLIILITTLVLHQQPIISTTTGLDNFLTPLLSPIFDNVCKEVVCGKGTCKASQNETFLYECECDPGWKQTRSDNDDHLKFLPCIVPNCSLNFSCVEAPAPVEDKGNKANKSFFDPCYWTDCGGGSCNKTSAFGYSCLCSEGYYNLLNVSSFPCFKECAIGADCPNLGLSLSNKTAPPAPALSDNSKNQASSFVQENFRCLLVLLVVSLTLIM